MTTQLDQIPAPDETDPKVLQDRRRLPSLTGLRFLAAFIVFGFHIIYEAPFKSASFTHDYTRVFGQGGWTGVSFFFVLSGFILTWSARPGAKARQHWRRRAVKILPNYVLTYAAAVLLVSVTGVSLGGWKALPGLFLIESWFTQPDIQTSANPVAWSLSCEAFFYLAFPLLLWLVNRIDPRRLWFWAAGFAGLVWCVPLIGKVILPSTPVAPWAPSVSTYQFWFVYVFPPSRALEFVLGMLMARIVLSGKWVRLPVLPAAALMIFAYAIAPHASYIDTVVAVTVVPIALLIAAVAAADLDGRWSPLRSRPMVWLGNVSFAFYLWHRLVLIYGHRMLGVGRTGGTADVLALSAVGFVIALLLAWLTFEFVERPTMRRWSRPRSASAEPVLTTAP